MLMAVPMGTVIGIIMTIGHFSLGPLVAAGAIAAVGKRYGFIPLWVLVVLIPLLTLAIFIQDIARATFWRAHHLELRLPGRSPSTGRLYFAAD